MHVLRYILDHSGYEFPISKLCLYLPLNELIFEKSIHRHHDNHHSKIMGNYASIRLLYDCIFEQH